MTFPKNKKMHYDRVARLGCVVSGGPATVHHVHGRSVGARLVSMGMDGGNGTSCRGFSDALVLPLSEAHHTGVSGIDRIGVDAWEAMFGEQSFLVDQVSERVGYDLFELHRAWVGLSKLVPRR